MHGRKKKRKSYAATSHLASITKTNKKKRKKTEDTGRVRMYVHISSLSVTASSALFGIIEQPAGRGKERKTSMVVNTFHLKILHPI